MEPEKVADLMMGAELKPSLWYAAREIARKAKEDAHKAPRMPLDRVKLHLTAQYDEVANLASWLSCRGIPAARVHIGPLAVFGVVIVDSDGAPFWVKTTGKGWQFVEPPE